MSDYFQALAAGLSNALSLSGILIVIAGTVIAMITSFLPGIGTASLMTLLVLATLSWSPESVLLLFGALVGGATFMGSITAILFNIPGGASNASTLLDGFPLAQRGYPKKAIAAAATASATGSIIGVVVLLTLLPFLTFVIPGLGPWEQLLLGVWGLSAIIALPNKSKLKAGMMCLLGLLLAMVGTDPINSQVRWNFGSVGLIQGLSIVPVLLGLFTLSEIIHWSDKTIEIKIFDKPASDDSVRHGFLEVFRHPWITLRSSIIGTLVGIVPGIGGTVAGFVAYSRAQQGETDNSLFGNGDIRGVIAPEAATDAKDGGSLIPAIALGLPGSEVGVFLIAVLALHGIVPGEPMLSAQLPLTLTLVCALLISNLLTSAIGIAAASRLAMLQRLPLGKLALPILVVSLLLIVQLNGLLWDLYVAILFGVFGYACKRFDWPRVPLVIAFILGEFLERNLSLGMRLIELDRINPLQRPIGWLIIGLIIASFWLVRTNKNNGTGTGHPGEVIIAFGITAMCGLLFITSLIDGYSAYSQTISLFSIMLGVWICINYARRTEKLDGAELKQKFVSGISSTLLPLMIVLPLAVYSVGLSASMGLLVLFWNKNDSYKSSQEKIVTGAWAIATAALSFYFLNSIWRVEFPPSLLHQVWLSI